LASILSGYLQKRLILKTAVPLTFGRMITVRLILIATLFVVFNWLGLFSWHCVKKQRLSFILDTEWIKATIFISEILRYILVIQTTKQHIGYILRWLKITCGT